ncbi:hypothetical protein SAICODRAFT_70999 [Saitoella complicata NRRL Y-17804]|uniref:UspA domain-containing protein n=1 Tax=Saitoella complicata (strain BCRC 22490 / CBS 7301 / JCM 7358 / NBRC 10748 / NRRL Y-17804) TaxID=698492 RepID=A0A0E9NRA5_SAICN|nr:uncharacterized protein SAICODRAFT_70999 [Saitoella complicata NRRL Y-17804]ODQ53424.1 hypothetical protein SAICODRAFT_70999 [Saitoella complicata NRRL Y-17804]GAO52379.1 hypothetical protein G7K_6457-t1 [Saitoella complicata NRRL Y-17804]
MELPPDFDASKPIRRRKGRGSASYAMGPSLESALEEERLEVLKLLETPSTTTRTHRGSNSSDTSAPLAKVPSPPLGQQTLSPYANTPFAHRAGQSGAHGGIQRSASPSRYGLALDIDLKNAARRLSDHAMAKSGGILADLPESRHRRNSSMENNEQIMVDTDVDQAVEESSEEEEEDSDTESRSTTPLTSPRGSMTGNRPVMSLTAAAEAERLEVVSTMPKKLPSQTPTTNKPLSRHTPLVLISDSTPAAMKKKGVRPASAFDPPSGATTPYSSDQEELERQVLKAAKMTMDITPISAHREAGRTTQTVTRGNWEDLLREEKEGKRRATCRGYLVPTDLSAEAQYALEWTIGTVLRDGDILYVAHVLENPAFAGNIDHRLQIEQIMGLVTRLLRRTRLQVKVRVEVIETTTPARYMLVEMIDVLELTMVIVGSRGRSAIKGVLLGSLSNYIVNKSSVPVMVARKKLRKTKGTGRRSSQRPVIQLANNLSMAKID